MLMKVAQELKAEDVKTLSDRLMGCHFENGIDLMCALYEEEIIEDCIED